MRMAKSMLPTVEVMSHRETGAESTHSGSQMLESTAVFPLEGPGPLGLPCRMNNVIEFFRDHGFIERHSMLGRKNCPQCLDGGAECEISVGIVNDGM